MYKLIRSILFLWQAEKVHDFAVATIKLLDKIPLIPSILRLFCNYRNPVLEKEVFGVKFRNPVGLAAGFDKNGDAFNAISNFGFGFVEIGSLTPKPQDGNPKPRCFRLTKDQAIVNRMGINNKGVLNAIRHLQADRPRTIIAASIAKNTSSTSDADAVEDYKKAFSLLYDFVDMFTVNVSCPNVEGLQTLQDVSYLSDIIDPLLELRICYDSFKPILVKVSPDIQFDELDEILKYCMVSGVDGIVAGNTTRSRDGLKTKEKRIEKIGKGGLSGAPLFARSLEMKPPRCFRPEPR